MENEEKKEKYSRVRFVTDFEDKDLAKDAMKKAKAFDQSGIGKWDIELVKGKVHYVFTPSFALIPILNVSYPYQWLKMGRDMTKEFKRAHKTHSFSFVLE